MTEPNEQSDAEATLGDVDARLALIEARIDRPLTAEQTAQVRNRIARSIALGVALRAYPLSNADEPEIAMAPYQAGTR